MRSVRLGSIQIVGRQPENGRSVLSRTLTESLYAGHPGEPTIDGHGPVTPRRDVELMGQGVGQVAFHRRGGALDDDGRGAPSLS